MFKRSDRRKPNTKSIRNFRQLSDKSFVDDFDWTGYCKYESRLVLRSTEIKPLLQRFVCTTLAGNTKMVLQRAPSNEFIVGRNIVAAAFFYNKRDRILEIVNLGLTCIEHL